MCSVREKHYQDNYHFFRFVYLRLVSVVSLAFTLAKVKFVFVTLKLNRVSVLGSWIKSV